MPQYSGYDDSKIVGDFRVVRRLRFFERHAEHSDR
jgi:hypothetical protein